MQELIGVTILVGLFCELFLLGHLVTRFVFKSLAFFTWLKPAIGLLFAVVTANLFYRIGLPLRITGYLLLVITSTYLMTLVPMVLKELSIIHTKFEKKYLWYAAVLILLLLPPILGGSNFQVFQGNEADHLSYQSISLSVNNYSYQELSTATFDRLGRTDPTANIGIINIDKRPVVELLYVSLFKAFGLSLIDFSYYFLLLLLIQAFYTASGYLGTKIKSQKTHNSIFMSLVMIGFWGQYIFDLNAWSFLLAIPIFILFCFVFELFIVQPSTKSALLISILVYALFATYPEASIFWFCGLSFYFVAVFFILDRTARWKILKKITFVPILSSIMILTIGYGAFKFFLGQTNVTISSVTSSWHLYFDAYLLGNNATESFQIINLLRTVPMGLLGLFFITPSELRMSIVTFFFFIVPVIVFCWHLLSILTQNVKQYLREPMFYVVLFSILVSPLVYQFSTLWALGKLVTFMLFPVLLLIAMRGNFIVHSSKVAKALSLFSIVVWSLSQFAFAIDRIIWSESDAIPHRRLPYISVGDPALKKKQNWEIAFANTKECNIIGVQVHEPFQNLYLSMKLVDQEKKWVDLNPVTTFFGGGKKLGYMRTSYKSYDCVITNELKGRKMTFQIRHMVKPVKIQFRNEN